MILIFQGILDGLKARHHNLTDDYGTVAISQNIRVTCHEPDSPELCIIATSDGRKKSGSPDGY